MNQGEIDELRASVPSEIPRRQRLLLLRAYNRGLVTIPFGQCSPSILRLVTGFGPKTVAVLQGYGLGREASDETDEATIEELRQRLRAMEQEKAAWKQKEAQYEGYEHLNSLAKEIRALEWWALGNHPYCFSFKDNHFQFEYRDRPDDAPSIIPLPYRSEAAEVVLTAFQKAIERLRRREELQCKVEAVRDNIRTLSRHLEGDSN